jgi:hypothetical protein
VVAVYVGYDDNTSMSRGGIKLAGASGALPAWLTTVQDMVGGGLLTSPLVRPPDGSPWPMEESPELTRILVNPKAGGLPASGGDGEQPTATVLAPARAVVEALPDLSAPAAPDAPPAPEAPAGAPATPAAGGVWERRARRLGEQPPAE